MKQLWHESSLINRWEPRKYGNINLFFRILHLNLILLLPGIHTLFQSRNWSNVRRGYVPWSGWNHDCRRNWLWLQSINYFRQSDSLCRFFGNHSGNDSLSEVIICKSCFNLQLKYDYINNEDVKEISFYTFSADGVALHYVLLDDRFFPKRMSTR